MINETAAYIKCRVLQGHSFRFFGNIPRSTKAGSCGKSILTLERNYQTEQRMVAHTFSPSILVVQAGASRIQVHTRLLNEFEARLGYSCETNKEAHTADFLLK